MVWPIILLVDRGDDGFSDASSYEGDGGQSMNRGQAQRSKVELRSTDRRGRLSPREYLLRLRLVRRVESAGAGSGFGGFLEGRLMAAQPDLTPEPRRPDPNE